MRNDEQLKINAGVGEILSPVVRSGIHEKAVLHEVFREVGNVQAESPAGPVMYKPVALIEEFRPVRGLHYRYEVSNLGRVRSVGFLKNDVVFMRKTPRDVKPFRLKSGYLAVRMSTNNGAKIQPVHCVVMEAFFGEIPNGMETGHLDNNKDNCRLDNLCWLTKKGNHKMMDMYGGRVRGEKVHTAKLTEKDVIVIKKLLRDVKSISISAIAKEYGVTYQNIYCIKKGGSWNHVKLDDES
jgi:hypothetical protein